MIKVLKAESVMFENTGHHRTHIDNTGVTQVRLSVYSIYKYS